VQARKPGLIRNAGSISECDQKPMVFDVSPQMKCVLFSFKGKCTGNLSRSSTSFLDIIL